MSNYQDRGLIKWMPFDALSGFGQLIYELTQDRYKKQLPLLMDDAIDTLNYTLQEAYLNHLEVSIIYYKHHKYIQTTGWIKTLDFIHKTLVLSTGERIASMHVIHLECV